MATFKMLCKCCGDVIELNRTPEMEEDVTAMACNFCCKDECQDKMDDYYDEWPIPESELPPVPNSAQIELFPNA